MSIEITLHPKSASQSDLKQLLSELGFIKTEHLGNWPVGSLHYHWFEEREYLSFDGVEATIFSPSKELQANLGSCVWALHTRTRLSASPADKEYQNHLIRLARSKFGGNFYNDWYGRNRYSRIDHGSQDAQTRGLYLTYEYVTNNIRAVRHALPEPNAAFRELEGTDLAILATADPARVLYNALVPFAIAAFEHFFSRCFKILLHHEPRAQERIKQQTRKIEILDVLAIQEGAKTIEDVVGDWYSFQSIGSINTAFSEWFGIDVWKVLRKRRKVGKRLPQLEEKLSQLIQTRHGIVHRFSIDVELSKEQIIEILDLVLAVIDAFVDHLETRGGRKIRN